MLWRWGVRGIRTVFFVAVIALAGPAARSSAEETEAAAAVLHAEASTDEQAAAACEALGKIGGVKAEKVLLDYLSGHADTDFSRPETRDALAAALSRIGGAKVEERLLRLLASVKGYWEENWLIVSARVLASMRSTKAVTPLASCLRRGDAPFSDEGRAAVADALAEIGDRSAADRIAAALAPSARPEGTTDISLVPLVRSLGRLGSHGHVSALLPLLKGPGAEVRAAALDALTLLAWTPSTPEEAMWASLARRDWAALASRGQKALPALLVACGDFQPAPEGEALLLKLGQPAIAALIAAAADAAATDERCGNLASLLGKFGPAAWQPLVTALSSRNRRVRDTAVEALGYLHDPRAIPLFVGYLVTERSHRAAQSAAAALVPFASAGGEALLPLLSGDDPVIRYWAAFALRSGVDASEGRLIEMGRTSRNTEVRGACGWVLAGMSTRSAREAGINLLGSDPSTATRAELDRTGSIWFILAAISLAREKDLPESYLDSKDERLRSAAELWARDHGYMITVMPG
jgi:HEAT repeat protein